MQKNTPTVSVNRKKYPVYFGMAALSDFEQQTKISLKEMGKFASGMTLQDTLELVYLGLKHGARRMDQECAFAGAYDVADFVDQEPDFLAQVMDIFTQQYAPKEAPNTSRKKK